MVLITIIIIIFIINITMMPEIVIPVKGIIGCNSSVAVV